MYSYFPKTEPYKNVYLKLLIESDNSDPISEVCFKLIHAFKQLKTAFYAFYAMNKRTQ